MDKVIWKRIVGLFLCVVVVLLMNISAYSQSSDFYAYYTRLAIKMPVAKIRLRFVFMHLSYMEIPFLCQLS